MEQIRLITQNHLQQCVLLAQRTDAVHAAQVLAQHYNMPASSAHHAAGHDVSPRSARDVQRAHVDAMPLRNYSNSAYVCTIAVLPQQYIAVPASHAANFVHGVHDVADDPTSVADRARDVGQADLSTLATYLQQKEPQHELGCLGVMLDMIQHESPPPDLFATCCALAHRSPLLRSMLLRTLAVRVQRTSDDDKPPNNALPFQPIHALFRALQLEVDRLTPSEDARKCLVSREHDCDCACAALEATLGCGKLTNSEREVLLSAMSTACSAADDA